MVVGRSAGKERERWAKNERTARTAATVAQRRRRGVASVGGVNGYLASRKSGANSDG